MIEKHIEIPNYWNEVPYMKVAQRTYYTESETLPLPLPASNVPEARGQCVCVYAHTSAVGMLG